MSVIVLMTRETSIVVELCAADDVRVVSDDMAGMLHTILLLNLNPNLICTQYQSPSPPSHITTSTKSQSSTPHRGYLLYIIVNNIIDMM